jgi:peptidoglycan/xylan/chitin deacetylase (PgdA/CDA1 family)
MRKTVRLIVAALFYYSGLVGLWSRKMQKQGPQLIILNYHRASRGDLRRQMLYLSRYYRVMHLDEALEELYAPPGQQSQSHDPRTAVVLTFDDGYCDNYTHAFKYACELHIPITLFLIPSYLDSGDYFWWGEGKRLVKHATVATISLDGRTYQVQGTQKEQKALITSIDAHLRYAHSIAERDTFLVRIRQELEVDSTRGVIADDEDITVPLTWAQVREMQESGWVSYGAHTMHHPVLSYISDPGEVYAEISNSREVLEERLGKKIRSFAYPIGRAEHIGDEAIKAVKAAGFSWAVTTHSGVATPQNDPYLLDRSLTDVSRHWLLLAAEVSGVWSVFKPLWRPFIHEKENL